MDSEDAAGVERRHEILIGAATGTAEVPQVLARRSDLDATLTVATNSFDRLMELVAK